MTAVADFTVRDFEPADLSWAEPLLDERFGGRLQARRGELLDVLACDGLVAEADDDVVGLLTYRPDGDECELALIVALDDDHGVGSALVHALRQRAAQRGQGWRRIWVVTTNDNIDALAFYQRRGFRLCAIRPGAVDDARRRLKPQISVVGHHGIPMRDELELALDLPASGA